MSQESSYTPDPSHLPPDICEHFCTKSLFMPRDEKHPVYESGFEVGTAGFWCVFTQTHKGEDGHEVSPDTCRPGRSCCLPRLSV